MSIFNGAWPRFLKCDQEKMQIVSGTLIFMKYWAERSFEHDKGIENKDRLENEEIEEQQ